MYQYSLWVETFPSSSPLVLFHAHTHTECAASQESQVQDGCERLCFVNSTAAPHMTIHWTHIEKTGQRKWKMRRENGWGIEEDRVHAR